MKWKIKKRLKVKSQGIKRSQSESWNFSPWDLSDSFEFKNGLPHFGFDFGLDLWLALGLVNLETIHMYKNSFLQVTDNAVAVTQLGYLKLPGWLLAVASSLYIWHSPHSPPAVQCVKQHIGWPLQLLYKLQSSVHNILI